MKTTTNQAPKELSGVIQIDEGQVKDHLGRIVRGAVEETLNAMLEAEAASCPSAAVNTSKPNRSTNLAGHSVTLAASADHPRSLSDRKLVHHVKDRTWLEDRHRFENKKTGVIVTLLRSRACGLVRRARAAGFHPKAHTPNRSKDSTVRPTSPRPTSRAPHDLEILLIGRHLLTGRLARFRVSYIRDRMVPWPGRTLGPGRMKDG